MRWSEKASWRRQVPNKAPRQWAEFGEERRKEKETACVRLEDRSEQPTRGLSFKSIFVRHTLTIMHNCKEVLVCDRRAVLRNFRTTWKCPHNYVSHFPLHLSWVRWFLPTAGHGSSAFHANARALRSSCAFSVLSSPSNMGHEVSKAPCSRFSPGPVDS